MPCKYKVFYNATFLDKHSVVIAIGTCSESGWRPLLEKIENSATFKFSMERVADQSIQIPQDFAVCTLIEGIYRSIDVIDDHATVTVVGDTFKAVNERENRPGAWVESGNLE